MQGFFKIYKYITEETYIDVDLCIKDLINFLNNIRMNQSFVFHFEISITFDKDGEIFERMFEENTNIQYFANEYEHDNNNKMLKHLIKTHIVDLFENNVNAGESGLVAMGITQLFLHLHPNIISNIMVHNQLIGSNVFGKKFVALPKIFEATKSIINIKNSDSKCFYWSLVASMVDGNEMELKDL